MLPVFASILANIPALVRTINLVSARIATSARFNKGVNATKGVSRNLAGAVVRATATFAVYEALGGMTEAAFKRLAENLDQEQLDALNEILNSIEGIDQLMPVAGWIISEGIVMQAEKQGRRFLLRTTKNGKAWFGEGDLKDTDLIHTSLHEYDENGTFKRGHDVSSSIVHKGEIRMTRSHVGFEQYMHGSGEGNSRVSKAKWMAFALVGGALMVAQLAETMGFPLLGNRSDLPTIDENVDFDSPALTSPMTLSSGVSVWNSSGTVLWRGEQVSIRSIHKGLMALYASELSSVEKLSRGDDRRTQLANKGATLYVIQNLINRLEVGNVHSYIDVALLVLDEPEHAYETYFDTSRTIASSGSERAVAS